VNRKFWSTDPRVINVPPISLTIISKLMIISWRVNAMLSRSKSMADSRSAGALWVPEPKMLEGGPHDPRQAGISDA